MALSLVNSFPRWLSLTCALGVLAFFVADENALVGALAILLVAVARGLTKDESHGVLPQWLLNLLVLAAAAWTAMAAVDQPENFVEALATLCAWVQVVKFYERPTPRNHAQLLTLSVFTVIAALLTSNSLPVGLMTAIYVPVAMWTILLFQIHAGLRGPGAPRQFPAAPAPPGAGAAKGLRRVTLGASVFMALIGVVVYLVIPRGLGSDLINDWSSPGVGTAIGFNEQVVLGRSGELENNDTAVLDLAVFDEAGRNIGGSSRAFLLRGAALDDYDPSIGVWRRTQALSQSRPLGSNTIDRLADITRAPELEQRVTIRNKSNNYLFAMFRPVRISFDRDTDLVVAPRDLTLTMPRRGGRVSYTVFSQADYTPPRPVVVAERQRAIFQEGPIRDLAVGLMSEAGFERDPEVWHDPNDRLIANLFERWLRSNFRYSTVMTAPGPGEDPIEMFLFRTREGHCEYFASAMAALCRAVGMDARVAVGYRASEFNEIAGHYIVRQSHAHSWVEAHVADGLWDTFDPSPPDGVNEVAAAPSGFVGRVREIYDAIDHAWVTWVVGFDESTRSRLFGVPQGNQYQLMDNLGRFMSMGSGALLTRLVRSLAFGVIVFCVVAAAGFAVRAAVRWRRSKKPRARRGAAEGDEPDPAILAQLGFYKRSLARLRRMGMAKPRWRPPLAHARAIAAKSEGASEAMRTLSDLYYAARFGRRALTGEELSHAEAALKRLEEMEAATPQGAR